MTSRQQRIQTLYEISLSIKSRESLKTTVDKALATYLQKLNCSVGAVFRFTGTADQEELAPVASIPTNLSRNQLFQTARDRLSRLVRATEGPPVSSHGGSHALGKNVDGRMTTRAGSVSYSLTESLPIAEQVDGTGEYHILELPDFGVIILGKRGGTIESETVAALGPLNKKLAQACRSNLTERRLREERDRFEAAINAIPEPVVNVAIEDGTERVIRANEAFRKTFVGDATSICGWDLNDLDVSDGQLTDTEALIEAIDQDSPIKKQVQRETVTGTNHFLFNGVPVTTSEELEYFGVYVDISEQKKREQTLEELYDAARDILNKDSRQQICAHAIESIESVLGHSAVGIYLYQRESEALEPIAVSEQVRKRSTGEPAEYTDRETTMWQVYKNHEPIRIDDTHRFNGTCPNEETPTRSSVILPIGEHGVLVTWAFKPNAFDDQDVYFLRLLSQLVEVALNRTVREERLKAIQETTRSALHADTHSEMAELVVDGVSDALDLPVAGIWKHQPVSQQLQPIYQTAQAADLVGEQPTFSKGSSIAWKAFAEGTTSVVADAPSLDSVHNPETPIQGEVMIPIGDFGVLTASSTHNDSFSQFDTEILDILATNLEAVTEVIKNQEEIDLLDQVIGRILRHNVRNKLTPILGYANTITKETDEPISEYAQQIVDSCEKLEQTVIHGREMQEIVQNRDQITTISLDTAVQTAAASINEEFPDGELITQIEPTPNVTAHPEVETAIRHLIRNGFEHNDSNTPTVEAIVRQRPAGPTIEIIDNGPGINPHEIEVLHEHGESALKHGSGVGLWIVDRLIEYSKAAISFETTDGTAVTITFNTPPADPPRDN